MHCPYCDHGAERILETKDYNRRVSRDTFFYSRCTSCGLIFLEEIPSDLARYYPADYHGAPGELARISLAAELERYKIDIVKRFKSSGRLLEVGTSYGAFCLLAKECGFEVSAIEMDADCCHVLETVVGVSAICSADAASTMDRLEQDFDVVALWHSIEHIPFSWEVMSAAARRLVPGGILLIAAPNPEAFQFHLLRKYWAHIDAPRHLYLPPMAFLSGLGARMGLSMTWQTTDDKGSRAWNDFGWQVSLANFAATRLDRLGLRAFGKLINLLISPFERVEGRGSCYTVVLQKDG